jgi:hypothetical protein
MDSGDAGGTLERRIKLQFPALFITLLSVLIGLVLADMVGEARTRIELWPLNVETLRSWGQLGAHTASALTAWIIYSHIGISHERIPSLSDSIVAFIVPLTLLLAMSLIGRELIWPWFYYGSFSLVVSLATSTWLLHLSRGEPEMARFAHLLRTRGYFVIFYVGIPVYAAAGLFDQLHLMPPVVQLMFAATPLPSALMAAHLFLRDWREAVAKQAIEANGE